MQTEILEHVHEIFRLKINQVLTTQTPIITGHR